MDNCPNINLTIQTSSTCWYHSIINPIVLSKGMRPFLYKAIAEYINIHIKDKAHLEDWLKYSAPSCISPHRPYTRIFAIKKLWGILFYRPRLAYTVNRNEKFNSEHSIRNLLGGAFRSGSLNEFKTGMPPEDHLPTALDRIGFLNYAILNANMTVVVDKGGVEKDFIVVLVPSVAQNTISYNGSNFKIESASIGLYGGNFIGAAQGHAQHAITGFKCGSEFNIFDSNIPTVYTCDWRNIANILSNPAYKAAVSATYGGGNPLTAWNEGNYRFIIYINSGVKNSFSNFTNDVRDIRPQALRNRIKMNQKAREDISNATKRSLLQEQMNAEAGRRISAKRQANRRAAAQRQAAPQPKKSNEGRPSGISNVERRRRALNESERRNALRRAAAQRQAAARNATVMGNAELRRRAAALNESERRNAVRRARQAAQRQSVVRQTPMPPPSARNLREMARIEQEAPSFIKNQFRNLPRLVSESANRLARINNLNNKSLNNFITRAMERRSRAASMSSWTYVNSVLERNVQKYRDSLADELRKARRVKNTRLRNLKGKGPALN